MHKSGQVTRWNEERGFGFIRSAGSHADVFFHARDFRAPPALRPHEGLQVDFEEIHVGGKGPRAVAVRPALQAQPSTPRPAVARPPAGALALEPMRQARRDRQAPAREHERRAQPRAERRTRPARAAGPHASAPARHVFLMLSLMTLYAATIGWAVWTRRLPVWVLPAWLAVNLVTFVVYWHDKYAASRRQWRTPESTLHGWSVAGGWPAAWWAQQVLRHKSSKASFRRGYAVSVALHWALLAGWLWWQGGVSFRH